MFRIGDTLCRTCPPPFFVLPCVRPLGIVASAFRYKKFCSIIWNFVVGGCHALIDFAAHRDRTAFSASGTRHIPDDGLSDIPRSVRDALNASGVAERLLPNGEVAIGVGSRGIAGLPQIVRATVDWFRERGARPFLVPCMGSHGGATAEGQLRVLEHLGVTAASTGCPIRAGMDTIVIGTLDNGLPVHMDAHATSADGVFVINRVKPHTAFTGPHESGLVKMLVIGLGKRNGADCCHSLGFGLFAEVMPQMARLLLERKPSLLGGLAVVENAHDRVCLLEAVLPERLLERDQALLVEARARMGSLPVDDLDVLLVDRMGKDISGSGMDPNVTGRSPSPYKTGGLRAARLGVLRLTEASGGNATGMGNADVVTQRLFDSADFESTYANAITSTSLKAAAIPLVMPSDEAAVRGLIKTCGAGPRPVRLAYIQDTLSLNTFWASTALAEELSARPDCRVSPESSVFRFDAEGSLVAPGWGSPAALNPTVSRESRS